MPASDGGLSQLLGVFAVFVLVAANGFFVAAEFSLVSVRRSRVREMIGLGRPNALALQRALDNLDANLAATQLGITISSLALGWIGEPALAHLVEQVLSGLPAPFAAIGSHAAAVSVSFVLITALHIVLGELAPKSFALQRSEATALTVVRPLVLFQLLLRPVIIALNGLGNLLVRLAGLRPGGGQETMHSPEELKLLVAASHEAGLLQRGQQEVMERVLTIGGRRISDIMTPRTEIEWVDIEDSRETILRTIRECRHEQLLVGKGSVDEPLGMILKKDLLDQALDGQPLDPMAVIREPIVLHEGMPIFRVLEQFKRKPVRLAVIVDEYGAVEGVVTQTDLLEAFAGELPDVEGEEPAIVVCEDGALLIDGLTPAHDAFNRLGLRAPPGRGGFHTIAGFALARLGHLPVAGERFEYEDWRFEILSMDGRRIERLLARRKEDD